jgi:SAM-dependent methyltransferase
LIAPARFDVCPACEGRELTFVEEIRGFEIERCSRCRLEFTANPRGGTDGYAEAYSGDGDFLEDTRPYLGPATRLALEADAYIRPRPHVTAAEKWVLRKLGASIPKGAVVLDVGCGTGRFLEILRRQGYRPAGVDPALSTIEALGRRGFDVRVGGVPGVEWDGSGPASVVMFEVLEHLPDPVSALRELHDKFPSAFLGGSVPSPNRAGLEKGNRGGSDRPPNHYLRWTPDSLRYALELAGYTEVEVVAPKPRGVEFAPGASRVLPKDVLRKLGRAQSLPSLEASSESLSNGVSRDPSRARRGYATAALFAHALSRPVANALGTPLAIRAGRRGTSGVSLGFWAYGRR